MLLACQKANFEIMKMAVRGAELRPTLDQEWRRSPTSKAITVVFVTERMMMLLTLLALKNRCWWFGRKSSSGIAAERRERGSEVLEVLVLLRMRSVWQGSVVWQLEGVI